ncbi:MAG: ABC transporter permease, partial [Desulfuromonadales bacterium]
MAFDSSGLASWDSGLLVFLANLFGACRQAGTSVDPSGLPEGVQKLLGLASPENQRSGVSREEERASFLEKVADRALGGVQGIRATITFIGEATLAFLNMLRGRANFRRLDLLTTLQETGAQAFSIVSLISLLVGMILAFVGAIQLKLFGAQIFVADVVGIGVVRVMGAIMTGLIMAGRTGAAFAAQLGTMQVNEEID